MRFQIKHLYWILTGHSFAVWFPLVVLEPIILCSNSAYQEKLHKVYRYSYAPLAPAGFAWFNSLSIEHWAFTMKLYSSCPRFHSGEKWARTVHPLKLPSPTQIARLGNFPPASQAGRRAGPVFYTIYFLWVLHGTYSPETELYTGRSRNKSAHAVDPAWSSAWSRSLQVISLSSSPSSVHTWVHIFNIFYTIFVHFLYPNHRVHIFTRDETWLVCLPIQLERIL